MNFAKKAWMAVGGLLFAAVLLSLAAPKAAHGLVAALVQITNTPANPVPVTEVAIRQPYTFSCIAQSANGAAVCAIAVPAQERFVVQTASALITTLDQPTEVSLQVGSSVLNQSVQYTLNMPAIGSDISGLHKFGATQPLAIFMDSDDSTPGVNYCQANIAIAGAAVVGLSCTLSGYLVNIP